MPKRASVIIVNYNSGDKLQRCLGSLTHTLPTDCEVIVVDNASGDGSADFLVSSPQARIKRIDAGANNGFGAACNLAAKTAESEYLVFLNPDTETEVDWLEQLLLPLSEQPEVGLSTSKIVLADAPEVINACGNTIHLTGITICRGLRMPRERFPTDDVVDAVSGAAFAMRRALFEDLGGFDESMFLYMEDTDLSLRARLAGWKCVCAVRSVVRHDYALRVTRTKVFHQERNRYLMLLKSFRVRTLIALSPALSVAEFITWGFVLLRDRKHLNNKWLAYRWILTHREQIWKERQAVQRTRRVDDRTLLRTFAYRIEFEQAAGPMAARVAHLVFDPIFYGLRALTLAVV